MTKRVAILISGRGSNMRALVEDMTGDHPARPVLVLSNNPEAAGIGWAQDRGLDTAVVDHRPFGDDRAAFDAEIAAHLASRDVDLICLSGFMRVLTTGFVNAWQGRMINIHPSLLPKYRGLNTHARALAAGDSEAGCTVHEVTPELDVGTILGQARVPVQPGDSPESLAARVLEQEHILYSKVLRRFVTGDRRRVDLASHG